LILRNSLRHQLRAGEARIAELEAERQAYQQRTERTEQWLHRIYTEIDDRFLKSDGRRTAPRVRRDAGADLRCDRTASGRGSLRSNGYRAL